MKSIFEQHGGTYTVQGDYRLPNLLPPNEEEHPIGVWGQRRLNYLKHHRKVLFYNLLTSCKLHSHLADVEEQAQDLFSRLVKEHAEKEGTTEHHLIFQCLLEYRNKLTFQGKYTDGVDELIIKYAK